MSDYEPLTPEQKAQWSQSHSKALDLLRSTPHGQPFFVIVDADTQAGFAAIGEGDNRWFRTVELVAKRLSEESEL